MVLAIEKTGIRWKKKKWVEVVAPKLFQEKKVGETFTGEIDKVLGSTVLANVGQLTNNFKKQNLLITLRVIKFEGEKAKTDIQNFQLEKSYVSRLIKKRVTKIADSFVSETKDKKKVRVKTVLVTRSKVQSSMSRAIYKKQRALVEAYIKKNNFNDILMEIINFKVVTAMKPDLDKIHPIKSFNIRFFGLEK